ncbi:unnamed protein product (macronuclear) [Paramecium tetraurelia]|uniref:Uncharacterized protein n=1 Tax=Paramecium tetraurelia TaxID=5888 RepID=A0CE41_PARTE|nr:uncharacterized protein GSPATT00007270001 [Paramecium tetraurelia]CAK69058.1 unnamed protein product [Paramecium tetraurelia]|eukprot:XP_001436455.1 hypothetical protein (macronuclear) [Paramecium tetraurelia strain d4-2]
MIWQVIYFGKVIRPKIIQFTFQIIRLYTSLIERLPIRSQFYILSEHQTNKFIKMKKINTKTIQNQLISKQFNEFKNLLSQYYLIEMKWILMIPLLYECICLIQIYNFDASLLVQDDWIINNGIGSIFSICNSQNILGGFNNFGVSTSVTRFFGNLDSHYELKIEMEFWRIDRWGFDQLKIVVDDDLQFQQTYRTMGSAPDYCGGGGYDDQYELISFKFPHKRKTAWVYIYVNYNTDFNQSWGFRTFKMSIEQCPQGCGMCSSNDYPQCLRWHYQESFFSQKLILGQEQWDGEGFPLSQYQSIQCANCNYKQGMRFHREIGLIRHQQYKSILKWNMKILLCTIRTDLQNLKFWEKMEEQVRYVQKPFNQNQEFRDIELYYAESENYDIIPFHPGCDQFINSKCISCIDGWIYDQKGEKCYSDCGDKVIQFLEECDDGNEIPYDGCFE